jgi:hypothetical protein
VRPWIVVMVRSVARSAIDRTAVSRFAIATWAPGQSLRRDPGSARLLTL